MKKHIVVFGFLGFALLIAPAAYAQAIRTWVSGVGDDVNPCSRTAPCKTFAGAISKTAAGGEISVLDNGSFGAITITKAITISGDGNLAGITSSLVNGIVVNAGVNDRIIIRGISIMGGGNGTNGIRFLAGKSLIVEDVTIEGFTNRGIDMSHTTTAKLFVRNTKISEGGTGIFVTTSGVNLQAQAMLDNVHLTGLTNGVEAAANGRVTITRSVVSGNTSNGILASGSLARINVDDCQISFNDVAGVNATSGNAIIRLSNNEIVNNNAGITFAAGALIESTGNNRVAGNVSTTAPNAALIVQ